MNKIISSVELSGITKPFEGNGRGFGYPTANIQVTTDLAEGIYFGFAKLGNYKNQPALIFIGTPTTVGASIHRVEAHLLDIVDKDYYGEQLLLDIHYFHRPNQHFGSIKKLRSVMKQDELTIRAWIKANDGRNSHIKY